MDKTIFQNKYCQHNKLMNACNKN